jgi:hypothetical protein
MSFSLHTELISHPVSLYYTKSMWPGKNIYYFLLFISDLSHASFCRDEKAFCLILKCSNHCPQRVTEHLHCGCCGWVTQFFNFMKFKFQWPYVVSDCLSGLCHFSCLPFHKVLVNITYCRIRINKILDTLGSSVHWKWDLLLLKAWLYEKKKFSSYGRGAYLKYAFVPPKTVKSQECNLWNVVVGIYSR